MGQVWRQLCKNENTPTLSETQMFVGTLVSGNLGLMWICAEFSRQEASNDVADLRWSQTGDFLVLSVAAIRNYPLQLGHSYRTSLAIEIFSIATGFCGCTVYAYIGGGSLEGTRRTTVGAMRVARSTCVVALLTCASVVVYFC